MFEQFGPLYFQLPSNIHNPYNSTYKRLYQRLDTGEFVLRLFDGTEENFADILLGGSTVNDVANVGWNENSTTMVVTAVSQIITGPLATRYKGDASFIQTAPNVLSVTYVGLIPAKLRLEYFDAHSSAQSGFLNYEIFKNGVALPDSNFQTNLNVARNNGLTLDAPISAVTGDVFDVRVITSNNPSTVTFRSVSFILTKLK